MRNNKHIGLTLILSLVLAMSVSLFAACFKTDGPVGGTSSGSGDSSSTVEIEDEIEITLSATAEAVEYETITLAPVVENAGDDYEIVWTSSNESVATVENGIVSGLKAGTAVITAAIGDKSATCTVTVSETNKMHTLVLSEDAITLKPYETKDVTVGVKFDGEDLDVDLQCAWAGLNDAEEIATVSAEGRGTTATFTGVKAGKCTYVVSATVRGKYVDAELEVTVEDYDYSLDFAAELNRGDEGGYVAQLTIDDELSLGDITVNRDGEPVAENVTATFESAASDVASVAADGKITAKKAGTAVITASYTYTDEEISKTVELSFEVTVTVVKKGATFTTALTIETSSGGVAVPTEVAGDVEKLTIGSCVVAKEDITASESALAVEASKLPCKMTDLGEGITVLFETETTIYSGTANVYTKIIKTKEELANWEDLACDVAEYAGLCSTDDTGKIRRGEFLSGYFVMANDIEFNGTYEPKVTYGTHGNLYNGYDAQGKWTWLKEWGDENNFGFKGVFDGKGHVVYGMTVSGQYNGFVTTLSRGTIKNLSFIDAGVEKGANFIVAAGTGTLENIYVKYSKVSNTTTVLVGTLYCNYNRDSRVTKNVIIDVTDCEFDAEIKNTFLVGLSYGTFENIILVGEFTDNKDNSAMIFAANGAIATENVILHYNSYVELFASEQKDAIVAALPAQLAQNGVIILPAPVMSAHSSDVPALAEDIELSIERGSSLTLSGTPYVVYSMETTDGVTLSGKTLTVSETATIGGTFVVTATSIISGNSQTFEFTVAPKAYTLGTEIDMDELEYADHKLSGMSSFWSKSAISDATDSGKVSGATGKIARFTNNYTNQMAPYGALVTLKEPLSVVDGLNYIKLRMYVYTTNESVSSMIVRFFRADRTSAQVGSAWYDMQVTLAANAWSNVYLNVSTFALDDLFTGFQIVAGPAGGSQPDYSNCALYIDYVSGMTNDCSVGEVLEMSNVKISGMPQDSNGNFTFGLSSLSSSLVNVSDITDEQIKAGATGYVEKYTGKASQGSTIMFNNPLSMVDGYNFIKLRVYVAADSTASPSFRFYRSDRTNHQVEKDVWWDAERTLSANEWTDLYLNVSTFAVDGKLEGFRFAILEPTNFEALYIDSVSIELNAYTLGDEIDMDAITLGKIGVVVGGISHAWNYGIVDASEIEGATGKVAQSNNGTNNLQYHGNTITLNTFIVYGEGFNYIKVRMYFKADDDTARTFRFYKYDETDNGRYANAITLTVNTWTDVYLDASKYVVDGKIEGFLFANFSAGAGTVYIDSIAFVSEKA